MTDNPGLKIRCYECQYYDSFPGPRNRPVWAGRCNITGRFVNWDAANECKDFLLSAKAWTYTTPDGPFEIIEIIGES